MDVVWFSVDAKGRLALPRHLRELAHIEPSSRVVGRVEPGRIVIEAAESVQARVWARAESAGAPSVLPWEDVAEAEVRTLADRERPGRSAAAEDLGAELLAELGL
jgi:bifunctional DNA-binding transcriptional regulator/antitoxin component of YhaV-PrlF toxin-antitoxin module